MAAAPRHARPFVAVFVTLLVVCAAIPLNLWPFSNWELFSRLRTSVENSWVAVVVEHGGRVVDYALARPTDCAPLMRTATARFGPTNGVRIYRVELQLSDRAGDSAAPPRRTLVLTCTSKGVHASS